MQKDQGINKSRVAIIGLGYVGMPLALLLVQKGYHVVGIDNNKYKIEKIRKGQSYLKDISDQEITNLNVTNLFEVTDQFERVTKTEVCILCVPTPLNSQQTPDLSYIQNAINSIKPFIQNEHLIILESSTFPGTTEEVLLPMLENEGKIVGIDFYLGYSPERIDPGNNKYKLEEIPKVISGVTKNCREKINQLYRDLFNEAILVSSPKIAEMTKLLENTQRFVNISFINEMSIICKEMGIDIWEVIEAANTKPFGFVKYTPGPGIGGHCIPVDPLYLSWKANEGGISTKFIQLSKEINDQMPYYIIDRIDQLLKQKGKMLKVSKLLLIGMTYKKDVNDIRESTSLLIYKDLVNKGISVLFHDPLLNSLIIDEQVVRGTDLSEEVLKEIDCAVILTNHSEIDYELIINYAPLIFDTRHEINDKYSHVEYL